MDCATDNLNEPSEATLADPEMDAAPDIIKSLPFAFGSRS